jgi:acetyltransferase-like isoleucine patch superfamily enzyme
VVAAGSVVTKDLPDHVLAAGVPAKVIKEIT